MESHLTKHLLSKIGDVQVHDIVDGRPYAREGTSDVRPVPTVEANVAAMKRYSECSASHTGHASEPILALDASGATNIECLLTRRNPVRQSF